MMLLVYGREEEVLTHFVLFVLKLNYATWSSIVNDFVNVKQ